MNKTQLFELHTTLNKTELSQKNRNFILILLQHFHKDFLNNGITCRCLVSREQDGGQKLIQNRVVVEVCQVKSKYSKNQ